MKPLILASFLLAAGGLMTGLSATKTTGQLAISKQTQESPNRTQAHDLKPNHIFEDMIPLLMKKTSVPLRLPEYVLDSDDNETPLYGILEVAEPERYSISMDKRLHWRQCLPRGIYWRK
jgi:hypothetical protein